MTKLAYNVVAALICSIGLSAAGSDSESSYIEAYDLEFFNDVVQNYADYYEKYYVYLVTHTLNVPPAYTKQLNAIFGGADFTSAIQEDPGLATVLYSIVTEFPWYSGYQATATLSRIPLADFTASAEAVATASSVIPTTTSAPSVLSTGISSSSATTVVNSIVSSSSNVGTAQPPSTITSAPSTPSAPNSSIPSSSSSIATVASVAIVPVNADNSTDSPAVVQTSSASTGGSSIITVGIAQLAVVSLMLYSLL